MVAPAEERYGPHAKRNGHNNFTQCPVTGGRAGAVMVRAGAVMVRVKAVMVWAEAVMVWAGAVKAVCILKG